MKDVNDIKNYFFFINGPCSNWYKSNFIVDGITFNCGEQWMMYQKAKLFGDSHAQQAVLDHSNPRDQKEIGRKVENYDDQIWAEKRFELVKTGLREKFRQNTSLRNYLLAISDQIIVEAASYDRIWGIGYDVTNPKIMKERSKWGLNLLGKCLNELAQEFK